MMGNPYLNRTMVKAPQEFFGRQRELQKILARIGSPRPQSVAVVGERRMGKSSLLYQAYLPERRRDVVPDPDNLLAIFIDLSTRKDYTVHQVFQAIFAELGKIVPIPPGKENSAGYDQFQTVVDQLEANSRRLIIFFDEFEAIANNPNIPASTVTEFLAFLRGIANSRAVAYVTSSQVDLQELGHSGEIKESPFFNIFTRISLGPLRPDEASSLIAEPSAAAGRALAPYASEVLAWAGTHPYFVQIACAALFDQHDGVRITDAGLTEARREFFDQAEDQFEYTWQRLSGDERLVLRTLAAGQTVSAQKAYALRSLERRGYVEERNGQRVIFSAVFAEHIPDWDAHDRLEQTNQATTPETQIKALLDGLEKNDPRYAEVLTFQEQLVRNLDESRRYGDTETLRADRNRIVDQLNRLNLEVLGQPLQRLLS